MNAIPDHMRYVEQRLNADQKPRSYYTYWVTGRGQFPFDMLRYDCAWPYDGEAAARMDGGYGYGTPPTARKLRSIKMASNREPTLGRWSSFNWSVSAVDPQMGET